ncbi:hypothetical protein J3B00_004403 [Pseudomonas sp. BP8]|nr:hypothetical protein [Pseudomonas sp. BP8]
MCYPCGSGLAGAPDRSERGAQRPRRAQARPNFKDLERPGPYGGSLFFLEKSNQKPLAPASGPYAALRGPLAPVLLREDRAVRPLLGLSAFRSSMASTSLRKTCARPPEVAGRSRARSRSTATATAGESLRSRFVCLRADLWGGWAGLRPAICIGSTGLFAGQARSYRDCAEFKICAIPVGAGLPREEARISTTHATIKTTPVQTPPVTTRRQEAEWRSCAGRWRPWMAGKR